MFHIVYPQLPVDIGVCVPKQCNATDVWLLLNKALHKVPIEVSKLTVVCKNQDYTLPDSAIATL